MKMDGERAAVEELNDDKKPRRARAKWKTETRQVEKRKQK